MRVLLLLRHAWNELLLWSATCEVHSAEIIVDEATAEIERAHALLAHNTRRMQDAQERVRNSGYSIERFERRRFLGI